MNALYIGKTNNTDHSKHFCIGFEDADKYLQMLRSDHFVQIIIDLPEKINDSQLRFMMHLSRITKAKAFIKLQNPTQSQSFIAFKKLSIKLGFFENHDVEKNIFFSKQKPNENLGNSFASSQNKLSIGFKSNEKEQIDEDQLMKDEKITVQKAKVQNCAEKPKACANCNCGRKDNPQSLVPKEKLIQSINQGKPVSGCGKCFLGDSFRCGSCPYKGLPAFKPGDKLKLMEKGQIQVQATEIKIQSGKVKIDL